MKKIDIQLALGVTALASMLVADAYGAFDPAEVTTDPIQAEIVTPAVVTQKEVAYYDDVTADSFVYIDTAVDSDSVLYEPSVDELAEIVIAEGINGEERKEYLGDRYDEVQEWIDANFVAPVSASTDVYTLARERFGLSEYAVTGCLKIISYEGYGDFGEWTLSYYCACACISCALNGDVYREFGRADKFYTVSNFENIGIKNWAYDSLREALNNYTYVYEINGVRYDFENAIYDNWCNGYHFGVWQN